jgi:hypothetical protein
MPAATNNHPQRENDPRNGTSPERWGSADVITEAEALRSLLQHAAVRVSRLLAILKQQRRHTKVLR